MVSGIGFSVRIGGNSGSFVLRHDLVYAGAITELEVIQRRAVFRTLLEEDDRTVIQSMYDRFKSLGKNPEVLITHSL